MISSPGRMMYLRPGNMRKDFVVKTKKEKISTDGTPYSTFEETGILVRGVLADADKNQSDRKKHLWNQDQHSLTHTMVCRGAPAAKKGDLLVHNERAFFVLLVDDAGELGVSTIYYVEERNDIK